MAREVKDFRFELRGCEVVAATATCELMITSLGADRELTLWPSYSRLLDRGGNEIKGTDGTLGSQRAGGGTASSSLVSGIAMRSSLRFEGVASDVEAAALLEVCASFNGDMYVQFRDVLLTRR